MAEKAPENKRYWLKILILCGAFFTLLLILFIGVFWYFLGLVFSNEVKYSRQLPTNKDFIYQQKIISRVTRQVLKSKPKVQELVLSKDEVYSLLRLTNLLVKKEKQGIFQVDGLNLQYPSKGVIKFTLTLNTKQSFIHGGFIYIKVSCSPNFVNGKLTLNIQDIVAGKVSLPLGLKAKIESKILEEISKADQLQFWANIFPEITLKQDNKIYIKYYPIKLLMLLNR
jgi:hypothetical protein